MGSCVSSNRNVTSLDSKDEVSNLSTEDDNSSVEVVSERHKSIDTNVLDQIVKNSPFLSDPNRLSSNDSVPGISKRALMKEVNLDDRSSWKKMNSSSFGYRYTSPTKKTTSSVIRPRALSTESSFPSKEGRLRAVSEPTYPTAEIYSSTLTSDEDGDSLSSGMRLSFDGLNMRPNNRYGIGLELLKAKIHHGANANRLSTHGDRTALMFAVLAKDLKFIKTLVELGVDVNQSNGQGETALGLACEGQCDDIAEYLRSQGALESMELLHENVRDTEM